MTLILAGGMLATLIYAAVLIIIDVRTGGLRAHEERRR